MIRADDNGHWAEQPRHFAGPNRSLPSPRHPSISLITPNCWKTPAKRELKYPPNIIGLFQPPLPCGVGACQACLIRRDGEEVPTCLEGPAFDLTTLNALKLDTAG